MMNIEFLQKVCRFTLTKLDDVKEEELQANNFELVMNLKSPKESSDTILIDLVSKKYTFIKLHGGTVLSDIYTLNEYYKNIGLEELVTIP